MSKRARRTYSPVIKTEVAFAAIRGDGALTEFAMQGRTPSPSAILTKRCPGVLTI